MLHTRGKHLPSSLKDFGKNPLPYKVLNIICKSSKYRVIDGCILSNKNELIWIPRGKDSLKIPQSVIYKDKPSLAHCNCIVTLDGTLMWTPKVLSKFIFPEGVKIIAESAFYGNRDLEEIRIPNGVKRIERGAFGYNQSLKAIYLPATIEYIGDLKTYQGWGRKYIEFFYPEEIHIPKGTKKKFMKLHLPEYRLIEDYQC